MSFQRFFQRAKWDRERREEIECYVQMETDENIARGMPDAEARAAAKKKLGNSTRIREEIYGMNTIAWFDTLGRDVRYALRGLRRNPTFTVVALLTLAIGIGANTAVFSVVNSVLLKPLNYPNPHELVAVRQIAPGAAGLASFSNGLPLSASMYFTYAEQNKTFQALGVWAPFRVNVTGLSEPEQVRGVLVSRGVLEALEVKPLLGRWLNQEDQTPAGPMRVMLTYRYWQRRFGGDRNVIGRNIHANSNTSEIVGVMPEGFRILDADFDLILPAQVDRSKLGLPGFGLQSIGRLKPGVTIAQANADIARLVPVWMRSWPHPNPKIYETWRITPAMRPLKTEVVRNIGDVLWVVMGTIGLVMIIACANVANLLLVRAEARQQELAVRSALGAGWGRIVRDLLIESLVLAVMGGAIGIGLAHEGLRFLVTMGPADLPRLDEISLDARALVFSLALSLVSGVLFGFIPALKYAKARLALGGRTFSTSRERNRARNTLVVAQVAMALVLLVSAGLMIRSFGVLRTVQPGFTDAEHLQTMSIGVPTSLAAEPERVTRIENDIADKLAAIPGVSSVGFASALPLDMTEPNWDAIFPEGQTFRAGEIPPLRDFQYVSPGLLKTEGTRMIAGREFTWPEVYGQRPLAMLSENLAREIWGTPQAAIGKRIRDGGPGSTWYEVIGVVEDVRERGVDQKAPETVYWPTLGNNVFGGSLRLANFAIRSDRAGTANLLEQIRQAVWSVNSNLPVANVETMEDIYSRSMARTSFTLVMLAIAGAMALVLGIVGIYGVIAYAVSQRRREIGIRLALGAKQTELKGMFVRQALALAAIGVAIGLGAAVVLARLMKALLFGISPLDPLTYAVVPMVLVAATMLASYLPARKAARVDPVEALRAE